MRKHRTMRRTTMTRNLRLFLLVFATALACGSALAQGTMRVRGTITSLDGNTLVVKSRDGRDMKLVVPDNVSVAVAQAVRFEDIKNGDYLGVTSLPGADGAAIAQELHYLAPTTAPGQSKWDLMEN